MSVSFSWMDDVSYDLLLAKDGDRGAFSRVVRSTEGDVRRFCHWFTGPGIDVDDVAQETFLRAFKGLDSFTGASAGRSWLLSISRRACLDEITRIRSAGELASVQAGTIVAPGDFVEELALSELMREVPEDFRQAFVLVKVLGLTYAEASDVLGHPIGTIQSRVARARVQLAALIENRFDSMSETG